MLLFVPFVQFIKKISGTASIQQKIANAHMIYTAAGVLLLLPFIPFLEKLLNKWLPAKESYKKETGVGELNPT